MDMENNHIYFGRDIKTPDLNRIKWDILEKKDNETLIICNSVIDIRPFDSKNNPIKWENSELRAYLNDEFFNNYFNDNEKNYIEPYEIIEEYWDRKSNTLDKSIISDKIFLLSRKEIKPAIKEILLNGDISPYAKNNTLNFEIAISGCEPKESFHEFKDKDFKPYYQWWLRSTNHNNTKVDTFNSISGVLEGNENPKDNETGVKPSLWINNNFIK